MATSCDHCGKKVRLSDGANIEVMTGRNSLLSDTPAFQLTHDVCHRTACLVALLRQLAKRIEKHALKLKANGTPTVRIRCPGDD